MHLQLLIIVNTWLMLFREFMSDFNTSSNFFSVTWYLYTSSEVTQTWNTKEKIVTMKVYGGGIPTKHITRWTKNQRKRDYYIVIIKVLTASSQGGGTLLLGIVFLISCVEVFFSRFKLFGDFFDLAWFLIGFCDPSCLHSSI